MTPTGAALLATLADRYGPVPSMVLERVGTGAGHRAWPDRPNIVRAWIGTSREPRRRLYSTDTECVLEANLDDMSPAHLAALERALFAAGAADVWSAPIQMKKGRHGVLVSALATRSSLDAIAETFLLHSTTLGIRVTDVARLRGERRLIEVETEFGKVRVKIAERPKGPPLVMPEFEDCDRLAQAGGTSVRAVFEAAQRAAWARRDPGDPSS